MYDGVLEIRVLLLLGVGFMVMVMVMVGIMLMKFIWCFYNDSMSF